MSARASVMTVERLRGDFFPWVLALVTGLDYLDNAIFSFFASYIAGGVNASPDELVWSSSAYAVAAVVGILQQQWWVDRLGHRRYVAGCLFFYACAAILSALTETSLELMFTRGLQGYFIGPMMGACRILIQMSFTPQKRAGATRAFLMLIVGGSAIAPLLGGWLVSHFDWRALFACTAPVAFVFAGLAMLALPDSGNVHRDDRGATPFWPYLLFAFAQGALQIVMQQVRFELFLASPTLVLLTAAGVGALVWFAWHQWHHPAPLVRLQALRERSFRVGIALYMLYYFESTGFSYLISRFLEQGLGYPVENAGRLVGVTSLISGSALFLYFRYSKYVTRKKWIIVPGFLIAALVGWLMTRMSPGVAQIDLVLPMLLRGLLLLFIVLPVANLTFKIFEVEAFTHSYRLKNIVRQLTLSFATAAIIIVEQHRLALHQSRLAEAVNPYNPEFQNAAAVLAQGFAAAGHAAGDAHALAVVTISQMVTKQASFLASLDGFYFLMGVAICGGLFAAWQKQID